MANFAEKSEVMEVSMIVAAGRDGAIGRNGELIWRIPADLRRFKSLTMGHPIIMGRKTWESLPKRPLPGRRNIVVTHDAGYVAPGAETASSPEEVMMLFGTPGGLYRTPDPKTSDNAFVACEEQPDLLETPFVIGGAQLYDAFFPYVTRIYLTEVDDVCDDADAWIPYPFDSSVWEVEEESEAETTPEGISYRYITYRRRT